MKDTVEKTFRDYVELQKSPSALNVRQKSKKRLDAGRTMIGERCVVIPDHKIAEVMNNRSNSKHSSE